MNACAVWEVRWGKAEVDDVELLKVQLKQVAKKWVFQEEKGDGGYEHYQGRISLFKKRRKTEVMSLMRSIDMVVPNYLAPTVAANHTKEAFYAMKADTRVAGPWSDADVVKRRVPEWEAPAGGWYPWQQKVIDSREVRCTRTINLVIDPVGNNGKSHLTMWLLMEDKACILPLLMDHKELSEAACDDLMSTDNFDPRLVIMDLPRPVNKKALCGVFTAIEGIKNGLVCDRRYHFRRYMFRPPQMWVFSNRLPNMAYASGDRWKIWTIVDRDLVPANIAELREQALQGDDDIDYESGPRAPTGWDDRGDAFG